MILLSNVQLTIVSQRKYGRCLKSLTKTKIGCVVVANFAKCVKAPKSNVVWVAIVCTNCSLIRVVLKIPFS